MNISARSMAMHLTVLAGLAAASPALAGGFFSRPSSNLSEVSAAAYASDPAPSPGPSPASAQGLLVTGLIRPDGATLEPAFFSSGEPSRIPPGPFNLKFRDGEGAVLAEFPFQAQEEPELPGHRSFAFVLPLSPDLTAAMAVMELYQGELKLASIKPSQPQGPARNQAPTARMVGQGLVRLVWDAASYPSVLAEAGGEVMGKGQGGTLYLNTDSVTLGLTLSDGLRSVQCTVDVEVPEEF